MILGGLGQAQAEGDGGTGSGKLGAPAGDLQFGYAEKRMVAREFIVEGVIEAVNKATLKAQTAGQVEEVTFDVDDLVEAGQVLARIKAEEQKASTAEVNAQVGEAQAYYKQAEAEFDRLEKSFKKGAISASRHDQAKADLNAAKARLNATLAASKRITTQQAYTEITAPYSGVVVERHIEPGEMANVGSPIMTGMSLDQLRVITQVPQSQVAAVRKHKKARVSLVSSEGERIFYDAVALTISPQADQRSHTFRVRVDLPGKLRDLFPGMYVKVAFTIGEEAVLLLPHDAVAYRGEVRGIYVKNRQGKLSMAPVRIGSLHGDHIEILAGIDSEEKIALDPVAAAVVLKQQYQSEADAARADGGR